jgi:hypothetical protein
MIKEQGIRHYTYKSNPVGFISSLNMAVTLSIVLGDFWTVSKTTVTLLEYTIIRHTKT